MKVNPFSIFVFTLVLFLISAFNFPNPEPRPNDKFVVVLDAGHGGHDPGNLGNGYLEKNIALGIVLEAGKVLETNPDIEVVYTRKDDRFVDLYVRGEIANKAKADLFVSIHCDSHNSDAHGAGTFVLGLHANKQNFEIAKKENSVIYLEDNYETRYAAYDINSPESIIGLTIMQEEFLDQSILLGKMMQDNFTKKLSRKDRKVKQAGFIVLHQTFMPSILVETGFLTNKSEGSYLNSGKGQAEMGKAIADAIILYKDNLRSPASDFQEGENVITAVPEVPETKVEEVVEEVITKEEKAQADKSEPAENPPTPAEVADIEKENVKIEPPVQEKTQPKDVVDQAVEKELNTPKVAEGLQKEKTVAEVAAIEAVADKEPIAQKDEEKDSESDVKKQTEDKEVVSTEKSEEKPVVKEAAPPEAEKTKKAAPSKAVGNVVFKVQILASSRQIPLQSANFKGLSTITKEPYKNLFRYMYGKTSSYEQAKLLKSNADLKGYTTSFIVAYKDGIRIPVQEAIKYSSE